MDKPSFRVLVVPSPGKNGTWLWHVISVTNKNRAEIVESGPEEYWWPESAEAVGVAAALRLKAALDN